MYKFVVVLALIAVASAARLTRRATVDEPIPILHSESDFQPEGSYTFNFEGGDGTARQEAGTLKNAGQEDAFVAVVGSYKYIDANGETVDVHYTADENGFLPSGGNIPHAIESAAKHVAGVH